MSLLLIPAIDLKDGQCVRLRQGDLNDATIFSGNPGEQAAHWVAQGARRIHIVDLNGAVAGKPKNESAIKAIIQSAAVRAKPIALTALIGRRPARRSRSRIHSGAWASGR
ncbi:MAG: 1-(5-phosphoribosyl)-5-[(5-phosphoribosylamino)methylideneamino]imidazole-4-carboxamide isomerase, partial [Pseudomonadota bacterium]